MNTNEFKFYCSHCDQPLKCEPQFAGRQIQCPACQILIRIPNPPAGTGFTQVAGCRSNTSPALTDRHLDKILAYFETLFWRGIDAATLQQSCSPTAVFRRRGYWASKNTAAETSRDWFASRNQGADVSDLEAQMNRLGYGNGYLNAIRDKVCHGRTDAHSLHLYAAALQRTLKAKARQAANAENPF